MNLHQQVFSVAQETNFESRQHSAFKNKLGFSSKVIRKPQEDLTRPKMPNFMPRLTGTTIKPMTNKSMNYPIEIPKKQQQYYQFEPSSNLEESKFTPFGAKFRGKATVSKNADLFEKHASN